MTDKRQILPLGLFKERFLSDINVQLFKAMQSCAHVWPIVETKGDFRRRMRASVPSAVLVMDSAISKPEYSKTLSQLVEYTKSGGTVICACNFSNNLTYDTAREFFGQWGLPWDVGSYLRTTVHRNANLGTAGTVAGISEGSFKKLPESYSLKSLSLLHVSPSHAIYNPSSSSQIESRVFPSDAFPIDPVETPCAFAPVGRGYFGYIGDVNSEEGSAKVVMAMAGLSIDAVVSVPKPSTGYGVTMSPDGSVSRAEVRKDGPNEMVMYSDCLRQAGHDIIMSNRMGMSGDGYLGPSRPAPSTRGAPGSGNASSSPTFTYQARVPPRPREAEVAVRAGKRAANSARKQSKADSLKEKGNDLFRKGDNTGAIQFYQSAVAVRPQATYYTNIAAAYLKLDDNKAAEDACNQALLYDPKNLKARYRRAIARRNQHRFRDALEDLKSCVKRAPLDPQFLGAMGLTHQLSQEHKAANLNVHDGSSRPQYIEDEDISTGTKERSPKPIEYESDSDSSDFEHEGNGTPCRQYNGAGCKDGAQKCNFKHAPDKKKVTRDELGRNVCNFYLMGMCKFGNRCLYAHSREYLPEDGWWCLFDPVKGQLDPLKFYNTRRHLYDDDEDVDFQGILNAPPTALEEYWDYEDMVDEVTEKERRVMTFMMGVRQGLL